MHLYLSMSLKYLIVLRQANRAPRNTKLAGLQATTEREGGGGVKEMEGYIKVIEMVGRAQWTTSPTKQEMFFSNGT